MEKLTAIITAYNRSDFVGICCTALRDAAREDLAVSIIVMDNGSTDDTAAVARAVGDCVRVIRTEDNRWVVGVINRGFAAAYEDPGTDYILLLNDDTEFLPGAIDTLLAACRAHPDAVLTPLQLNYHQRGKVDTNALRRAAECHEMVEDLLLGRPLRQTYPQRTIIGAAMIARAATWKAIGEFDELFWFTGSDDDYCNRAHWLGYEVLLVPGAHMYHAHGGLHPSAAAPTRAAEMRKYRLGLQARYMFKLKDPDIGLARAVWNLNTYAWSTMFTCAARLWLPGFVTAKTLYLRALCAIPRAAAARRRHFDPARKRSAPPA